MTESDDSLDPIDAFLEVLRTGKGDPCLELLAWAFVEGERRRQEGPPEQAEARSWLASIPRGVPLALNHFNTRAELESFVADLYHAGATAATVQNTSYEDIASGGSPSSDTLLVALPDDAQARARVFALCN